MGRLTRNPADAAYPRTASNAAAMMTWDAHHAPPLPGLISRGRRPPPRPLGAAGHNRPALRRGDGPALDDVDLDAGRARLQTVIQSGSEKLIGEPKTAQGRRPLALDPATVAELRSDRVRMLEERLLVGSDFHEEGWVFHRPDGSRLRPDATSYAFVRRVERYGLPRLTLHGPRYTWGNAGPRGGHPPPGRPGAPLPLHDRDHPGDL